MSYLVTLDQAIDLAPATEREEILQNVRTIIGTLYFSVPLARDLGIAGKHIDKPLPAFKTLFVSEVYEAVEAWEPRARIESVEFEATTEEAMDGKPKPRVYVSIVGEEEEEEL